MKNLLRKLRGALGVALTWGVLWGAVFAALGLLVGVVDPDSIDPGEEPWRIAGIGFVVGIVAGTVFGVLLALLERHKTVAQLSLLRVALWGAIAAAAFPLLTARVAQILWLSPIGALLAAGSVAMARRAELRSSTQPPQLGRS